MNRYKMLIIKTLSNLHAGSGETHFSVVDNLVQRDPVTRIPVIHASGIKGALREHFEKLPTFETQINSLFGTGANDDNATKEGPGHLIFFEASLLTIPLRSFNKVFYNATSPSVIKEYMAKIKDFIPSINTEPLLTWLDTIKFSDKPVFYTLDNPDKKEIEIEDFVSNYNKNYDSHIASEIKHFLGVDIENLAIFNDVFFREICEDYLPVVARNHLDNGTSINLFYEEFLPRMSQLYFLLGEENEILGKTYDNVISELTTDEKVYQFGGNFSVGYGFTTIRELKRRNGNE